MESVEMELERVLGCKLLMLQFLARTRGKGEWSMGQVVQS